MIGKIISLLNRKKKKKGKEEPLYFLKIFWMSYIFPSIVFIIFTISFHWRGNYILDVSRVLNSFYKIVNANICLASSG